MVGSDSKLSVQNTANTNFQGKNWKNRLFRQPQNSFPFQLEPTFTLGPEKKYLFFFLYQLIQHWTGYCSDLEILFFWRSSLSTLSRVRWGCDIAFPYFHGCLSLGSFSWGITRRVEDKLFYTQVRVFPLEQFPGRYTVSVSSEDGVPVLAVTKRPCSLRVWGLCLFPQRGIIITLYAWQVFLLLLFFWL